MITLHGKKIILVFSVILVSVFLGMLLRFMMALHFHNEEGNVLLSSEVGRNENADEKNIHEIESSMRMAEASASDDTEIESTLEEKQGSTKNSSPRLKKVNKTKKKLSSYGVTPRKTVKEDLIPRKNTSTGAVLNSNRNKHTNEMYFSETAQKYYMSAPIGSVDVRRIWR